MPTPGPRKTTRRSVSRRDFLKRAGWTGAGATATALLVGSRPRRTAAAVSYPDWIPASTTPPKRGGVLNRAAPWDPPVIDPRLTQSIGTFQFVGLTSSRLIRYAFPEEAAGTNDLTLKGDLAESWQASPDYRTWTFKLRQGVKWQHPAVEWARAHRGRREVLLRGVCEGGTAVVHVP
jgi:ABC-type transport system substrate-binding protein